MTANEAANLIDISAVRTAHSLSDIEEVVAIAKQYNFINVHSLPCWTKNVSKLLKDFPDIYVGAPVGFPGGAHKTCVKVLEARELIADGVEEMDIVMNIGKFKNKEYDYVLNELNEIIALAPENVLTKVIIEINCLTDEELDLACELVMQTKADFLKTGTGWVPGDANIERIARIKELTRGKIKVKAAGGIRTREEFEQLYHLGVERFGINTKSALEIVESFK
ncbi:deoxyribose-phosphate aldolase [Faecalicatena contorta]|jgi:deoxyribose-phosphate aldolase|uniref:Deoxyribose-phosphate aldolase n=1 Tax=Faecalicatena contorta TaxID=39482 RepID=A0A315ZYM1_9FIRM|nr:deoxyribose-phosphate aldolase [Faecalicatena contorta]PWJ50595.1 deoxyribose-phosphate aldolase [Faecalicatena contorta]SUQ14003.1 deoxyribose-phosphate aldolase [Faecalicatena contorta]